MVHHDSRDNAEGVLLFICDGDKMSRNNQRHRSRSRSKSIDFRWYLSVQSLSNACPSICLNILYGACGTPIDANSGNQLGCCSNACTKQSKAKTKQNARKEKEMRLKQALAWLGKGASSPNSLTTTITTTGKIHAITPNITFTNVAFIVAKFSSTVSIVAVSSHSNITEVTCIITLWQG